MSEKEMETIADLMKKCLLDGQYVGDDVRDFRKDYRIVWYSFDEDFIALDKSKQLKSPHAEE
jgi:hypothetical protein